MNKGIISKISVLVAIVALSGCSSLGPRSGANIENRPILSAAEAEAQVHVTVRPVAPAVDDESLVAAVD